MSKKTEIVDNKIDQSIPVGVHTSNEATELGGPTATGLPAGFKIARRVTLPLSKWKNESPKYLRIECEIFQGKEISAPKKEGEATKEPAWLFNATDLQTGEMIQVIAAKVLKSTLAEEYPDNGYVGKMFELTQHRDTAKNYNTFSITEIEAA